MIEFPASLPSTARTSRSARTALGIGLLAAVVCLTSGCNPFRRSHADAVCKGPEGYANASSVPSLKVPAGLESPDTRGALRVPDLNTPAPRVSGDSSPAGTFRDGTLDALA